VAARYRAFATELDEAPAVVGRRPRELALLGEAGTATPLLDGPAEEPARTAVSVDVDHRAGPGDVQGQVQQRLGDVVGLGGATRDVDDGYVETGRPAPAKVVAQPHRAGGVTPHRGDSAKGGAGAEREHGRGAG